MYVLLRRLLEDDVFRNEDILVLKIGIFKILIAS